ncbi:hypothetical protein FACS189418_5500 [Clostridia bacterium]|nr:hypothetical protein FACS189418_5500 [Clostridia bacterium]
MLSDRLKKLRKQRNIKQFDIAKELNLSREAYSMYETGKRQPSFDCLFNIANYFDVSIDYLLCRTDIAKPVAITQEELMIIRYYQKCDLKSKETIRTLLRLEANRMTSIRKVEQST